MKGRVVRSGIGLLALCSLLLLFQSSSHLAVIYQHDPNETAQEWVDRKLAAMSLEEKVGQMFIVGFEQSGIERTELNSQVKSLIRDYHVGGVILFERNIESPEQVGYLTNLLQRYSLSISLGIPLVISIDQEGGPVTRFKEGVTKFPGNMALGASRDPSLAYAAAQITGKELRAMGINMNMAPVLDVNNNPANPVIGIRSFAEDPELTAAFAVSTIQGYRAGHVLSVGKHFPGHGDTSVDSHVDLPMVPHERKRLDGVELVPFRAAIAEGIDVIMTAHVTFPAIDPTPGLPATLSKPVLTGLLRQELGYTGVIMTDDMEMGAIADHFGTEEAAIRAVDAGADMILISHTFSVQRKSIEAVIEAVKSGDLSEARIDQSVRRILTMKAGKMDQSSIVAHPVVDPQAIEERVGTQKSREKAEEIAEKAVTLVKDDGRHLPLSPQKESRILIVSPIKTEELDKNLREQGFQTKVSLIQSNPNREEIEGILNQAADFDAIIVGTSRAQQNQGQAELVKELQKTGKALIVLGLNTPYDLSIFPSISTYLSLYSTTPASFKAAANAITGKIPLSGRLPVSVPKQYPLGHGIRQ